MLTASPGPHLLFGAQCSGHWRRAAIKTSLLAQEGHREANEQVGALATMILGRSVSPDDREEFLRL